MPNKTEIIKNIHYSLSEGIVNFSFQLSHLAAVLFQSYTNLCRETGKSLRYSGLSISQSQLLHNLPEQVIAGLIFIEPV